MGREYFAGQDFPPVADRKVLEDKSTVHYWYKQPDLLIKHQLGRIISPDQLDGLKRLDLTIERDHCSGRSIYCFAFTPKKTISRLFQIASVSHSKDELPILKSTVLDPISEGLRLIVEGGRFSVKSNGNDVIVSFTNGSEGAICDVNNRVLVVCDLKFYVHILGRENMSSFWCMWCNAHLNTWQDMNNNSDLIPWTIERIKEHKSRIVR
jgi:hypothetical protein